MKTTKFRNSFEISKAVLGVLQIPEAADKTAGDPQQRIAALRGAIDMGANYLNLGYPYYFDEPEAACDYVKSALSDGYRERVQLALNLPADKILALEDLDAWLEKELGWFELEKADVCIISGIYRANWHVLKQIDLKRWLDEKLADGTFRYVGFSFHDEPHYITPICNYYDKWTLMQVDYSFMDERHHPGNGGIILAEKYGLCVIASEVLKGGRLVSNIPETVQSVWDAAETKHTPAQWCIRYVYNNPGVSAVQFSFATEIEAREYLAIAEESGPDMLDLQELLTVRSAMAAYEARQFFACPACRCCMPCPRGVDAPRVGELYNDICMYGDVKISLLRYRLEGNGEPKCVNCGACVTICPKKNPLPEAYKKMEALSTAN